MGSHLRNAVFVVVIATITALPYNVPTTSTTPTYQQQHEQSAQTEDFNNFLSQQQQQEQYQQPQNLNDFLSQQQQQEQYQQPQNLNDFLQQKQQQQDEEQQQRDASSYRDRLLPTQERTSTEIPTVYQENQHDFQMYNELPAASLTPTTFKPIPQQDQQSYADALLPKTNENKQYENQPNEASNYSDSSMPTGAPTSPQNQHHVENAYADQISQRINKFSSTTQIPIYQQQQEERQNRNLADVLNQGEVKGSQMSQREQEMVNKYLQEQQNGTYDQQTTVQQYLSGVREAVEEVQAEVQNYSIPHNVSKEEDGDSNGVKYFSASTSTPIYNPTTPLKKHTRTSTTTTTKPTTLAATAEAVAGKIVTSGPRNPSLLLCNDCVISHGVGFASLAGSCSGYIQCTYVGGDATAVHVMSCPAGTQWNQDILACDFAYKVGCEEEKLCKARGVPGDRTVYQVFSQDYYTWETQTCPEGYAYNAALCSCSDRITSLTTHSCYGGDMKPIPDDDTGYLQRVHNTWVVMPCPATTTFNPITCLCDIVTSSNHVTQAPPTQPTGCQPTLRLTFTKGVKDESPNGFWIENRGVKVIDGKGHFDGTSQLVVPGLSNMDLGSELTVTIRYKQTGESRQTLVSNGCCGVQPSIQVCAAPGVVYTKIDTEGNATPTNVTVTTDSRPWQTASFSLQQDTLTASSETDSVITEARGRVLRKPRGLVIGAGGDCQGFTGLIEEVSVFKCNPASTY